MSEHTASTPFLALSDFLAAFGLDSADVKSLNIYHENGGFDVSLELNPKLHSFPDCNSPTSKIKDLLSVSWKSWNGRGPQLKLSEYFCASHEPERSHLSPHRTHFTSSESR